MQDDQHEHDCGHDECHKVNIAIAPLVDNPEMVVVSVGPIALGDLPEAADIIGSEEFADTARVAIAGALQEIERLRAEAKAKLN